MRFYLTVTIDVSDDTADPVAAAADALASMLRDQFRRARTGRALRTHRWKYGVTLDAECWMER